MKLRLHSKWGNISVVDLLSSEVFFIFCTDIIIINDYNYMNNAIVHSFYQFINSSQFQTWHQLNLSKGIYLYRINSWNLHLLTSLVKKMRSSLYFGYIQELQTKWTLLFPGKPSMVRCFRKNSEWWEFLTMTAPGIPWLLTSHSK